MENHCWRDSRETCTNDNEKNWPKSEDITQINHHHQLSPQAQFNERLDLTLTSRINLVDHPEKCVTKYNFGSPDEKAETSSTNSLTVFNSSQRVLEKDGRYRMLNIYKLSLNIPTVRTWERSLRLKKNNLGIIKNRKKSLINLKEFILQNASKSQLPVILHKDSLSHPFPINFFDDKSNQKDVCSINLNQLKISRGGRPVVSERENHELIRKMSSLSCKNNILNHRDSSRGIIMDDTITFCPNLEKTLDGISLESKIQDYYDEPENKSQDYNNYSLRIDEIQEIDKIGNLSIQDVDDCRTGCQGNS